MRYFNYAFVAGITAYCFCISFGYYIDLNKTEVLYA